MAHARLSPSKAKQWMACPGSIRMAAGLPDEGSSVYADEGTAAHFLASFCLEYESNPADHIGREIAVGTHPESDWEGAVWAPAGSGVDPNLEIRNVFEVDDHMAENVAAYVDKIHELAAGGVLLVEQRLRLNDVLDGVDEGGTADAVILNPVTNDLRVDDLKYGRGVPVYARGNPQLYLYALGAFNNLYLDDEPPATVTVAIHQPRIGGYDEYTMPFEELMAFAREVKLAAAATRDPDAPLIPGPEQCRWCKAKGFCPALAHEVLAGVTAANANEFVDLDAETLVQPERLSEPELASALAKVDMIEDWCSAIRARCVRSLEEGHTLPGYKLVAGKKGPRQWAKDAEAQIVDYLSGTVRLNREEMFKSKLITPTQAEKLVGPVQYKRLEEWITQSAGSPAVVPESDKRPAIKPAVAAPGEFENVKE